MKPTDILILVAIVAGVTAITVAYVLIRKAIRRSKKAKIAYVKKVRAFENEYGELHTKVDCVIYSDSATPEELARAKQTVREFRNALIGVEVPEGGTIVHNFKTTKKK